MPVTGNEGGPFREAPERKENISELVQAWVNRLDDLSANFTIKSSYILCKKECSGRVILHGDTTEVLSPDNNLLHASILCLQRIIGNS